MKPELVRTNALKVNMIFFYPTYKPWAYTTNSQVCFSGIMTGELITGDV